MLLNRRQFRLLNVFSSASVQGETVWSARRPRSLVAPVWDFA